MFLGASDRSAGAEGISMYKVVIPPGAAAEPHRHKSFETAIYLIKGRVETRFGPGLKGSVVNGPGDFVYIPPDLPHQPINVSDSEPAEAIVARNDPSELENVIPYDPDAGDDRRTRRNAIGTAPRSIATRGARRNGLVRDAGRRRAGDQHGPVLRVPARRLLRTGAQRHGNHGALLGDVTVQRLARTRSMRHVPRVPLHLMWVAVVVAALSIDSPAFSQGSTPTPTRQDPAVSALPTASERHQANLDRLEKSLELTQRELALLRAEISNDLDRRFLSVQILGVIVVFIGFSSVAAIWVRLKNAEKSIGDKLLGLLGERVSVQIAKRIQGIDPTSVPVHYPQDFERELQRLRRFGFSKLIPYEKLDDTCVEGVDVEGVVIINLSNDDGRDGPEVREFERLVETYGLKDSAKVGFMFYNTSMKAFPKEIFDKHPIIDYSSSLTTLSANIMTVARNLNRSRDASGIPVKPAVSVDDSAQQDDATDDASRRR